MSISSKTVPTVSGSGFSLCTRAHFAKSDWPKGFPGYRLPALAPADNRRSFLA